jgi:N-acetylglutamate synthase-like GNAT family acetyltransferase
MTQTAVARTEQSSRAPEPALQIRLATPADMNEVMKLAVTACKENAFLEASAEMLAREIWPALVQDHGLMALIGPPGGAIEGLVLLRIGTIWYSKEQVLEEKAIFVYPEFRSAKGGRAKKLCDFSKKVADTLGMKLLIGVLSAHRTEGKVAMYTRQFGPPMGAFWLYGTTTGDKQVVA